MKIIFYVGLGFLLFGSIVFAVQDRTITTLSIVLLSIGYGVTSLGGCGWLWLHSRRGFRNKDIVVTGDELAPKTRYQGRAAQAYGISGMVLAVILFILSIVPIIFILKNRNNDTVYAPIIDPANFSKEITNPFFALPVGRRLIYEGKTNDGIERVIIEITGETKIVMGVETSVYWDKVWLNDELVEDTRDYLAQDSTGNVWYFGEDVDNYANGELVDHAGSWLAGEAGAQPGIWFKANPQIGDTYRQEYLTGEAEDQAEVLAINETVTVLAGQFTGCVKTYDWTPLDPNAQEHKYYCPAIGGLVLEVDLQTNDRVELIQVN